MKVPILGATALLLGSLLAGAAMAQPPWARRQTYPYSWNSARYGNNLPPGLQKHVYRTGHLPPGLEKRYGTWGYYNQPKHFNRWDRDRAWDRYDRRIYRPRRWRD